MRTSRGKYKLPTASRIRRHHIAIMLWNIIHNLASLLRRIRHSLAVLLCHISHNLAILLYSISLPAPRYTFLYRFSPPSLFILFHGRDIRLLISDIRPAMLPQQTL